MSADPRLVSGPLRVPPRRSIRARRPPTRRPGLDVPLEARRSLPTPQVDAETFGRWSERFARFMGTAHFILWMTVFVAVWVALNVFGLFGHIWDPYPFILLTLMLSLQASYAAPLILLAQNRQADRDRVAFEQDRQRTERGLADTEYLAREVAALRIALRDVATRDFLRSELRDLLEELTDQLTEQPTDQPTDQPIDQKRPRAGSPTPTPPGRTRPDESGGQLGT